MALLDDWDSDISVSQLLDRAEAKQSLRSQDRLEIVMGIFSIFQDQKGVEAGIEELFRLSLGALADLEEG